MLVGLIAILILLKIKKSWKKKPKLKYIIFSIKNRLGIGPNSQIKLIINEINDLIILKKIKKFIKYNCINSLYPNEF